MNAHHSPSWISRLLIVAMVDFYLIDRHILHPQDFRQHEGLRIIHDRSVLDKYKEPDVVIRFLKQDQRHFRVFPMDSPQRPFSRLYQSNRFMNFGICEWASVEAT